MWECVGGRYAFTAHHYHLLLIVIMQGFNRTVTFGVLPAVLFASGHMYFVQVSKGTYGVCKACSLATHMHFTCENPWQAAVSLRIRSTAGSSKYALGVTERLNLAASSLGQQ